MPKTDADEEEVLAAFDSGKLNSVATKAELAKLKAAARATAIKDRRVNIRLSSGDLCDIQVRALEEGVPYQTLIASVLHKYVTGRLTERPRPERQVSGEPVPEGAQHICKLMAYSSVQAPNPALQATGRIKPRPSPEISRWAAE
jgi:predicted DNA binding CopG/RHH family protein